MPGGAMPQGGGVPGGNQFDKDGDGKLSPAEMQAAMKSGAGGRGGVPGGAAAMPGGAMPLGGGAKPGAKKSKLRLTPRGSMLSRDAADGGDYGFNMMAFDKDGDGKLNAVENKAAMEGMKKMMRTGGKIGDVVGGAIPPGENMPEGANMPVGGNMPAGEKMPVGGNMPGGAKMPGGPGGAKTKPKPRDIGPGGFEYRYIWKFDKNKDGQLTGQEKQKAQLLRKKLLDKEMKKMMKQKAPR